jgi:phage FluMu protein Com
MNCQGCNERFVVVGNARGSAEIKCPYCRLENPMPEKTE